MLCPACVRLGAPGQLLRFTGAGLMMPARPREHDACSDARDCSLCGEFWRQAASHFSFGWRRFHGRVPLVRKSAGGTPCPPYATAIDCVEPDRRGAAERPSRREASQAACNTRRWRPSDTAWYQAERGSPAGIPRRQSIATRFALASPVLTNRCTCAAPGRADVAPRSSCQKHLNGHQSDVHACLAIVHDCHNTSSDDCC